MKKNSIPTKNYVIVLIISLLAIFMTYYIFSWYNLYENKKFSESYLIKTNTISLEVNDLTEIESTLSESPNNYFVYIGYRNDENVYKLEKQLKKVIDKYNLNDIFYYIDITDLKEEDNYLEKINEALDLTENKVTSVPTIIYFKDGTVSKDSIISREDGNMMSVGDFEKLLEIFEITK